jgi:UDP-GlcNAc:undecaprenyl-phosphate GlcNAc-1-phosphate transferase
MTKTPALIFVISFLLVAGAALAVRFSLPTLPPEVPLWYTQAWGPQRLASPEKLYLIPALGAAILALNFIIYKILVRGREESVAHGFALLTFACTTLLTVSVLRIINLVGPGLKISFSTLSPLLPLLVGFLLSLVLTPILIRIGKRLRLIDRPHGPYIDVRPLVRLGGVVIFISFSLTTLIFLPLDKHLIALLLGGMWLTVVGTLDDFLGLSPLVLGVSHLVAALILVLGGLGVNFISNPLSFFGGPAMFHLDVWKIPFEIGGITYNLTLLSDLFTILWVFGLVNIVDWLDGLDGLASGVGIIASVVILAISLIFHTPVTAVLSLALGGVLLGFLLFNFSPAKILLGSGGYLLGFLLATLAVYSGGKIATAFLVLALPMLDTLIVLWGRLRRGRPLHLGDKTHLHHRLLEKGLSVRQVVLLEWGLCGLLGAAAVFLTGWKKLLAIAAVFIAGLLFNQLFGLPRTFFSMRKGAGSTVSELKGKLRRGGVE